ncbi:inner membrane protein [Escherichia coli]|nr:inner membrane protein [Escherichia coli]
MIIAVYLWFCAFAKHRHMTIKGQKLVLPSWKFALAQMLISSVNWMVMGAIIWLLLGQSVNYFFVLGVLLVSSIAGVIVHIPAGIGVLEAVFIALLGWGAYLQRHNYRRPARLPCAVLLYPTAAGADLLPVAGKARRRSYGRKMKRRCEV